MKMWFACKVTSGRKSTQYGIRFSYPLFISAVALGIFFVNPYILFFTALIALFGMILPMHPFDYVYNFGARLLKTNQIPGRGSESQVSSAAALIFILGVIASIIFRLALNYEVMALAYLLISIFFVIIQLFTDNFSIYSIFNLFFRRGK